MTPKRSPGWQGRLHQYIEARRGQAFRPGRNDCACFAAGAVAAMTGTDLSVGWRYGSLAGGRRLLKQAGFADHVALAAQSFETTTMPGPGDLAVLPAPDGSDALGIVQGEAVYVVAPDGLGIAPLAAARLFFRVP